MHSVVQVGPMIVICTTCQAKFLVGDEKVGPNGVKVRCGKCKTVFAVRRPADPSPALPPEPQGVELRDPSPVARTLRPSDPSPSLAPNTAYSPAAPEHDPFASSPADDPFATAASSVPGFESDPFGSAERSSDLAFTPSTSANPPFHMPELRAPGEPSGDLPLTDLSDLATTPAPSPFESADLSSPPVPPPLPIEPDGLALEEVERPAPMSAQGMLDSLAFDGGDPFQPQEATPGLDLGYPEPVSNDALLDQKPDMDAPWPAPAAPQERRPSAVASVPRPPPAAGTEPPVEPVVVPEQRAPSRSSDRSGLRTVVLNSLSLALLVVVTLALLTIWQQRPVGAHGFSLGRLFSGVLGRSSGSGSPVFIADVGSGAYETSAGRRVFFVRGKIRSRSSKSVGQVVVRVALLRDGQVIADTIAPVGGMPSAEELWNLTSVADLERLRVTLAARSRQQLLPGEEVPFLAPFWDDLARATGLVYRVAIEADSPSDRANPG